jgi:hypothetical protein
MGAAQDADRDLLDHIFLGNIYLAFGIQIDFSQPIICSARPLCIQSLRKDGDRDYCVSS